MDETPDLPALLPAVTYLREVALEGQELHRELLYAGFTEKQATNIVAQMVIDALSYRDGEDDYMIEFVSSSDDDDELDDEDDNDYDGDSGI